MMARKLRKTANLIRMFPGAVEDAAARGVRQILREKKYADRNFNLTDSTIVRTYRRGGRQEIIEFGQYAVYASYLQPHAMTGEYWAFADKAFDVAKRRAETAFRKIQHSI